MYLNAFLYRLAQSEDVAFGVRAVALPRHARYVEFLHRDVPAVLLDFLDEPVYAVPFDCAHERARRAALRQVPMPFYKSAVYPLSLARHNHPVFHGSVPFADSPAENVSVEIGGSFHVIRVYLEMNNSWH